MSLLGTIKKRIEQRYFNPFLTLFLLVLPFDAVFARVAGDPSILEEDDAFLKRETSGGLFNSNRWDHNFAFTFGMAKGSWRVEQLDNLDGVEFESRASFVKAQYSFHLPLWKDLGYVLGSSFGYYWEKRMDDAQFHRVSSIHFPGIHLGLVYSFAPSFRILGGVETYLERLDDIAVSTHNPVSDQDQERKVSITMRPNFDWILASDVFFTRSWGLRLEWHSRKVISSPPSGSFGQVVGARLTKKDTWIGLGVIFHLFAT